MNILFNADRPPRRISVVVDAPGASESERKAPSGVRWLLFGFVVWLAAGTLAWAQTATPGKGSVAAPTASVPGATTAAACDKVILPGKARLGKAYLEAQNFERALPLLETAASEPKVAEPVLSCVDQLFREALAAREKAGVQSAINDSKTAGCDKIVLSAKARLARASLKAENFDRAISLLELAAAEPNVTDPALTCIAQLFGEALAGRERSNSFWPKVGAGSPRV